MLKISISIPKAGKVFDIDESDFADNVLEHVHTYGWRKNLHDSCASAKDEAEAVAMVEKRLDAFRNGLVRTHGVTAANVEDVAFAEVVRGFLLDKAPEYTKTMLKKAVKTRGQAESMFKDYVKQVAKRQGKEFTEAMVTKNWDKLIKPKASQMIAALAESAEDVDL